jgi:hypothetical protein
MRDTGPAAAAALDYGLSQRALIAISGRTNDVPELITCPCPPAPERSARQTASLPRCRRLGRSVVVFFGADRGVCARPCHTAASSPGDALHGIGPRQAAVLREYGIHCVVLAAVTGVSRSIIPFRIMVPA